MNQILKKRVAIIALFALFISLTNCVNESIDSSNQNNSVANAKKWFELNKPSLSVLNYTKSIDWNNAIASTGDMGTIIEVPLTLKESIQAKVGDDNSYKTYNRLMFIADTQGTYKTYHVLITTNNTTFESTSKDNNFYNLEDNFDGYVTVLGAKDKIVNFKKIVNGVETKPSLTARAPLTCVYFGEISYPVGIDVPDFRALYLVGCYSETNNGLPLEDYGAYHGGGGGGAGNKAQAIEDQIDNSKLDPCTKAVLDKLKNLSGGDITNMLKRFTPPGSVFNINMSVGKVNSNANWAETTPLNGSRTDINMVFNENYINGTNYSSRPTDLSVATTMAHEVIHAYLISLLEENKACGASGICDFPTIYDAYVQQQISKNPNLTVDEHHELIANKYVNTIAATIQEFHTGQSVAYPLQVYLDLAWGGLTGTYVFNKDYPNDPNDKNYKDRERIFARINTEKLGTQYGINSPIGTPCKK
jgi:hypothetical protein